MGIIMTLLLIFHVYGDALQIQAIYVICYQPKQEAAIHK